MQSISQPPSVTAVPTLRPLDLGDILDGTFRLYRNNFVLLLTIVAVVQVPLAILRTLLAILAGTDAAEQLLNAGNGLPPGFPGADWFTIYLAYANAPAATILGLLDAYVVQVLIVVALVYAVSRRYLNLPVTLGETYRYAVNKIITVIVANILLGIGTAILIGLPFGCLFAILIIGVAGVGAGALNDGGSSDAFAALGLVGGLFGLLLVVALVIAALLLTVRLSFYPQTVVVEGQGPIECLTRSWKLVAGQMWRTLGIYLVISILGSVLLGIILLLFIALGALLGVTIQQPLESYALIVTFFELIRLLTTMLVQPFTLIGLTLLYYDLRVRKEGLDMELQAASNPASTAGF
jgi:hypothetical protein